MHQSEEHSASLRWHALELAMRDVLDGMEELSLAVAYAHLDFSLPVVAEKAGVGPVHAPACAAAVIPFPQPRRAAVG